MRQVSCGSMLCSSRTESEILSFHVCTWQISVSFHFARYRLCSRARANIFEAAKQVRRFMKVGKNFAKPRCSTVGEGQINSAGYINERDTGGNAGAPEV